MAKSIDDLIAESEIKDLHIRFCRANDRRDEELMLSCFHPDAVVELHKPYPIAEFVAFGNQMLSRYTVTWHNTGNQLVEVDGDTAWAEHYTISSHRIAEGDGGPERDFIAFGRYIDRVERRGGEWKFARRKMLLDYVRTDIVADQPPTLGTPTGSRDRNDASYAWRLRG